MSVAPACAAMANTSADSAPGCNHKWTKPLAKASATVVQVTAGGLHRYAESTECATACQHDVAEVACCRTERTLMGCAGPPSLLRGSAHPSSVLELTKNEVFE